MQQVVHKKTAHGIVFISLDSDLAINLAVEIQDIHHCFCLLYVVPYHVKGTLYALT